jgi:hypothetical protein
MGFLDEVRKKNKIAKSLVSNGLAPSFDVAVKMAEARMRVESGAQEPIENAGGNALASTTISGLKNSVTGSMTQSRYQERPMTLEEQKRASIMMYRPTQESAPQRFTPMQPPSVQNDINVNQNNNQTSQMQKEDNEGNNMNTQDFERIMNENTRFITEQLIDFKSQLATISASVEMLKQDLSSVKHDVLEVRTRPGTSDSSPSEGADGVSKPHTDSSGGQHFVIHPPEGEHHEEHKENPRGDPSKINAEDVSIEKMFNFSHKKF